MHLPKTIEHLFAPLQSKILYTFATGSYDLHPTDGFINNAVYP